MESRTLLGAICRIAAISLLSIALSAGAFAAPLHALPLGRDDGTEGKPSNRRLYLGLWTLHLRDPGRGLDSNWLLGVAVGKIYAATFINSFGNRAYSAGFQDVVARWNPEILSIGFGYRVGLVTGYDERFIRLAGKTPVLPLVQPLLIVERQRLGVEFSYSGVVASAGFMVRF